jgi:hypothetical protein
MLVYFVNIWNILRPFGIIYGQLVQFAVIWYIFPIMVCLDQEKSGNPGCICKFRSRRIGSWWTLLRTPYLTKSAQCWRWYVWHLMVPIKGGLIGALTPSWWEQQNCAHELPQWQCYKNLLTTCQKAWCVFHSKWV